MKAKVFFVWLVVLQLPLNVQAVDPLCSVARSQALANVRVMLSDEWSALGNPAGLGLVSGIFVGIHYSNHFMVPELGTSAFSLGIPAFTGTFSLCYASFGNSYYHENQLCLSYGRTFGAGFRAGIGLHYLTARQPADAGNLSVLVPALGIQALLGPSMTLGLRVFNPAGQQYMPEQNRSLPVVTQSGVGFQAGKEVLLCLEAEKCSGEPLRLRGGMEIDLRKTLKIRFGISSGRFPYYSFGLGWNTHPFVIDLSVSRHPVLGFSPSITVTLGKN